MFGAFFFKKKKKKNVLFANIGHCPSLLDEALMGICGIKLNLSLIIIVNDCFIKNPA